MFLDDMFLVETVDNAKVMSIFQWAVESGVSYVRMNPMKKKVDERINDFVGLISRGALYRTSTIMSLWKKDVLRDLLKSGESAWEFELIGSERSDRYDDFYVAWKNSFEILNTVIRGKWLPSAAKKIKSFGVEIDLESRKPMALNQLLFFRFKEFRSRASNILLPTKYRRKIRKLLHLK